MAPSKHHFIILQIGTCVGLYKVFLHYKFNPHNNPMKCSPSFTEKETEAWSNSNKLLKITKKVVKPGPDVL